MFCSIGQITFRLDLTDAKDTAQLLSSIRGCFAVKCIVHAIVFAHMTVVYCC